MIIKMDKMYIGEIAEIVSINDDIHVGALIESADSALYEAKGNGRNRVNVCGEGL